MRQDIEHSVVPIGAEVCFRGRSLTTRPDQCTAVSEIVDMIVPRHTVIELEGVIRHGSEDFRRQ